MTKNRWIVHMDGYDQQRRTNMNRWRAEDTARWLERSGPLYADVAVKLLGWDNEYPVFQHVEDGDVDSVDPQDLSYASWLMVRDAEAGDKLCVKIRVDEVAANR